jgi:excisionase family DNA binding protein
MDQMSKADLDWVLTPAEVARVFGVDPKTVAKWADRGKIPFLRTPGGHRRYRLDDVYALRRQEQRRD